MISSSRTCCITGTAGYVGACMVRYFLSHGWRVIELNRCGMVKAGGSEARAYKLGDPFPTDLIEIKALVHVAYDFTPSCWNDINEINVLGTKKLFYSAHDAGVEKLIYISSMSSFDQCHSLYGKAKLQSESHVRHVGGISVRPGLIYDENQPGGMVGKLNALISMLPVIPLPGNGKNILYFTHQEDLCHIIENYASACTKSPEGYITTCNSTPWMFKDILKELALRKNRRIALIPTPWQFSWIALRVFEFFGINISFKSDNLVGLLKFDAKPLFSHQDRFRKF